MKGSNYRDACEIAALGLAAFLFLIGIGGCSYLMDLGSAATAKVSVHDNTVLTIK